MSARQSARRQSQEQQKAAQEEGGGGGTRASSRKKGGEEAAQPTGGRRGRGSPRGKGDASDGGKGSRAADNGTARSRKRKAPGGGADQEREGTRGSAALVRERKRLRGTVLSYKESLLQELTAVKAQKDAELRKCLGKGPADSYGATLKNGVLGGAYGGGEANRSPKPLASGLPPLDVSHRPNGAGAPSPLGSPADDDDTPPLILGEGNEDMTPSPVPRSKSNESGRPTCTPGDKGRAGQQAASSAGGGGETQEQAMRRQQAMMQQMQAAGRGPVAGGGQGAAPGKAGAQGVVGGPRGDPSKAGTGAVLPTVPGFGLPTAAWPNVMPQPGMPGMQPYPGGAGLYPPGLVNTPGGPRMMPMMNQLGKPGMPVGALQTGAIDPKLVPPALPSPARGPGPLARPPTPGAPAYPGMLQQPGAPGMNMPFVNPMANQAGYPGAPKDSKQHQVPPGTAAPMALQQQQAAAMAMQHQQQAPVHQLQQQPPKMPGMPLPRGVVPPGSTLPMAVANNPPSIPPMLRPDQLQQQQALAGSTSSPVKQQAPRPPLTQAQAGGVLTPQQQQQQQQLKTAALGQPPKPPGAPVPGVPPQTPPQPTAAAVKPQAPPPPPPKAPPVPTGPFSHPFGKLHGGLNRGRRLRPGKPPVPPVTVSSEAPDSEVAALLERREKLIATLRSTELSSVVHRPGLLPAGRRKTQWDYLLDEMRWLATDYHEERKWKMASARVSARAAAGEALKRTDREVGNSQQARRVAQKLSQGVMGFWRNMSSEIRSYADNQTALRASISDVAAAAAAGSAAPHQPLELGDVAETNRRVNELVTRSSELLKVGVQPSGFSIQADAGQEHLLPHQLLTVRWLYTLHAERCGGILADQAGMGKTVTSVAVMVKIAQDLAAASPPTPPTPQLIITPYWCLVRWMTELQLRGPQLTVALLEDWASCRSSARARKKVDVVLCSTATLGSDNRQRLTETEWSSIVLDTRLDMSKVSSPPTSPDGVASEWAKVAPLCPHLRSPRRVLIIDYGFVSRVENHASWAVFLLPHVFPTAEHVTAWASKALPGADNHAVQDHITKLVTSFQVARRFDTYKHLADVTDARIITCPMPESQLQEYRRVYSLTLVPSGGLDLEARKVLACRYASMHADLPWWCNLSNMTPLPTPPPPAPGGRAVPPPPPTTAVYTVAQSRLQTPTRPSNDPATLGYRACMEDTTPMGPQHSLSAGVAKSGKLNGLLQLLPQLLGTPDIKVLLLAGLPHALSLIHTFLCAAEIPHEYASPERLTNQSDAQEGPEPWLTSQLAISRFNANPNCRVLVANTWGCWGRGGLVPSAADVVVVVDDEWSMEGRAGLRELLMRMRMRRKPIKVYRMVSVATMEGMLWDTKRQPGESKLDTVMGGLISEVVANANKAGADGRPMEALLWEHEKAIAESLLPPTIFRATGAVGTDLCRDCFHRRAIGSYAKRLLREAAGSSQDLSKWSLSSLQRGSPVDMILGVEDWGGEASLLHEARNLLVHEIPADATKAQAWLELSMAMRSAGIEIDPVVIGPPVHPPDNLQETITHPSYMLDPAEADLGLVIKYVQIIDTVATTRRKKIESRQRPSQPHSSHAHHPHHHGTDASQDGNADASRARPLATVAKPRTEMPTDWTTEEDQELLRAVETFGRNKFIIPFVLSKKTPPHVRQRSAQHCLERIDMLTGQNAQGIARAPRPVALPPIRVNRVVQEAAVLEVKWTPPPPPSARKAGRPELPPPGTPGFLPGPDPDSQTRLGSSTNWIVKVHPRLHAPVALPDANSPATALGGAGPGSILGNITPSQTVTPLQFLTNRKDGSVPSSTTPNPARQSTPFSPLTPGQPTPAQQSWSNQTPGAVSLGAINPCLVPAPAVVAAYQASLKAQGKGRKRDAPGAGGLGGLPSSSATLSGNLKMKGPSTARRASTGSMQGIPPIPRAPGLMHPPDMSMGGGGAAPMAVVPQTMPVAPMDKHPTVTMPHMAGMPGALGKGQQAAKKGGRPVPTASQLPSNQVYMQQVMSFITQRPELKTQITTILQRSDLTDAQRIEQIGEIFKAANAGTSLAGIDVGAVMIPGLNGAGGQPPPGPPPPPPPSAGGAVVS